MDISGVVPEAREIVRAAADVYIRHTRLWFVGFIVHGSAVTGDFVPGCSDVDLRLYLEDAALVDEKLPFPLAAAIQRDLSAVSPAPFRYLQGHALPASSDQTLGPVPGAYVIVAGDLPVPEATPRELREEARSALEKLDPYPAFLSAGLLESGGSRLSSNVRLLCTKVWPVLYHVLSLREGDPTFVWSLPKRRAIDLLPEGEPLGHEIRSFYGAVISYYPDEEPVGRALTVLETGLAFLGAAKSWYDRELNR